MDNNILLVYPQIIAQLFYNSNAATKKYFLSLPEDKQLELIHKSNTSSQSLHDCIETLKLKE